MRGFFDIKAMKKLKKKDPNKNKGPVLNPISIEKPITRLFK